jgi:hypothetical protein
MTQQLFNEKTIVTITSSIPYPFIMNVNSVQQSAEIHWGDNNVSYLYNLNNNTVDSHTYTHPGVYDIMLIHSWADSIGGVWVTCSDTFVIKSYRVHSEIRGTIDWDSSIVGPSHTFWVMLMSKSYDSTLNSYVMQDMDTLEVSSTSLYSAAYLFNVYAFGEYYVKAMIKPSTINPGLIPSYHFNTSNWQAANVIEHDTIYSADKNIYFAHTTASNTGNGSINGNVSLGKGRGTNTGVAHLLMFLRDSGNKVIDFTYTDDNGGYDFGMLEHGIYSIYPEEVNYQTTPSLQLTINSGNTAYTNIDFEKQGNTIVPKKQTTINEISNNVFSIYPNPTSGMVNINWKKEISSKVKIHITDISGRLVFTLDGKTTPVNSIDITSVSAGMYLMKVITKEGVYVEKLVVE